MSMDGYTEEEWAEIAEELKIYCETCGEEIDTIEDDYYQINPPEPIHPSEALDCLCSEECLAEYP